MHEHRNRALDGLRGVAALSVLVFHVWDYARPVPHAVLDSPADYALNEGRLGLILFFVLSGFLLYGPWVRAALSGSLTPHVGRYLIRRASRIVPAYYLAVVGSVVLLWGASGTPGVLLPPATSLPLFAIFAQNYTSATLLTLDAPTWTLAIEASFYLALPLIAVATTKLGRSRRRQVLLPLALIGAGLVWNASTGVAAPFNKALPSALPYFGAGMLVAVCLDGRRITRRDARWLMAAGFGAVLLDAALHSGLTPAPIEPFVSRTVRDLPAAAGFAAIVAAAGHRFERRSVLSWRPLVALGTISYGVYLWHLPLLLGLRSMDALPLHLIPAFLLVFAVTVAVAMLSWFAVEKPSIRWAQRMTRARAESRTRARRPGLATSRA